MNPKPAFRTNGHATLESMSVSYWYNAWTINKFQHYLKGSMLEIGCGIGTFTDYLSRYGNVWAFDIDPHCVSKTKQHIGKKAHIGLGDIERGRFFFKRKKFDTAICINVLEHINNDAQALRHIKKLLNKNGTLVLLVPAHPLLFGSIDVSIGHYRRYTKPGLIALLRQNGFNVNSARRLNFLGALGWWVSGKWFPQKHVPVGSLKFFDHIAPYILPWETLIEPPLGTSYLIIATPAI